MKRNVLYIEDSEPLRYAICRILERGGFDTIEAESGDAALKVLDVVPNVVLLDLSLPVMSGEDVLRHIREKGIKTRVIVFTGMDGDRVERAKELKPDVILTKPTFHELLLAACGGADQDTIDRMKADLMRSRPG